MSKRKIELFTAGCPACEPVVELVRSMACENCSLKIYDLSREEDKTGASEKIREYNISSLPAVVVNGQLLDCCKGKSVSRDELERAGVGKGG